MYSYPKNINRAPVLVVGGIKNKLVIRRNPQSFLKEPEIIVNFFMGRKYKK